MAFDGTDTIVLFDKLAYEDLLPVRWVAREIPVDETTAQHLAERNLRVLQACDALEEHGQLEKSDDESPHSADLMRLDLKINLLLDLVGQLVAASQARAQPRTIRINSLGATFGPDVASAPQGSHGILEVGLRDLVVPPLSLPAQIVAAADEKTTRVCFIALGEVVADHLEKLVFRRHRRKIADARRPRRAEI